MATQTLNCVKDTTNGLLPASFSLHSVDLLPLEDGGRGESNYLSVTFGNATNAFLYEGRVPEEATNATPLDNDNDTRHANNMRSECRVIHGNDDVHALIRVILQSESIVEATEDTPGVWSWPLPLPLSDDGATIKIISKIIEAMIRYGWEITTCMKTTTSPGYEAVTIFFKRSTTPVLYNAQVCAVALDEVKGVVEVVSHEQNHVDVNNAVHRAVKKCRQIASPNRSKSPVTPSSDGRCSSDMAHEIEMELRKSHENLLGENILGQQNASSSDQPNRKQPPIPVKTFAKPMYNKRARDDPQCPHRFNFEILAKSGQNTRDKAANSRLVLEIAHLLFCRQWKLVAKATLPKSRESGTTLEVLYFCRDGRILPALGQQGFAAIDLEQPDMMRLLNVDEAVAASLKSAMLPYHPRLTHIQEDFDFCEFKWAEPLWTQDGFPRDEETATPTQPQNDHNANANKDHRLIKEANAMASIGALMLAMNKHEFNLYGSTRLSCSDPAKASSKRCQLIFRQSNVSYSQFLCLHLSGFNKLIVVGGKAEDLELIRAILKYRWPYQFTRDEELKLDPEQTKVTTKKPHAWLFKVKRYPWAVSYGNKRLDRAVEIAQTLLHKALPPPTNMDADSGRSVIVFLLRELGRHGWRIQTSLDIGSQLAAPRRFGVHRETQPFSVFLLR